MHTTLLFIILNKNAMKNYIKTQQNITITQYNNKI